MMKEFHEQVEDLDLSESQKADVRKVFDEVLTDTVDRLKVMISYWESVVEGDQSLYTLGLRRSIDMIESTAAYDRLPILETSDTPDE